MFYNFYKNLYKKENIPMETDRNKLHQMCKRPTDEQEKETEEEITKDDIEQGISDLNRNKAPGPDGLTAEFYKHFKKDLIPILKKVYGVSFSNGTLPKGTTHSFITLIPKEIPDKKNVKSYRPTTLLNTDHKISSKVLTAKLKTVMERLVHEHQQ